MVTQEQPDMLTAAGAWYGAGYSVVPPKENGTKAPVGEWKQYQTKRASKPQMRAWYKNSPRNGLGVVTGHSKLELLEFENDKVWSAYQAAAEACGLGELLVRVAAGYLERSPGGGVHLFYRCSTVEGNTKLAAEPILGGDEDERSPLIETRGKGGYAIVAPSNGTVHPSGKPYVLVQGSPVSIVEITPEERADLFALARTFDRLPRPKPVTPKGGSPTVDGKRPGDDYNRRASWPEILEPAGWTLSAIRAPEGETYWTRPGKTEGVSASTNYQGSDLLYVWTTSTKLEAEHSYTKFGAYAILNHNGDWSAAAKALSAEGYGNLSAPGALTAQPWPQLGEPAWHGLAGRLVRFLEPATEADPVGLLLSFLVTFGSLVGPDAYAAAGSSQHPARLYAVLVGDTSRARKGTAQAAVAQVFDRITQNWREEHVINGLASGEGLIAAVQDEFVGDIAAGELPLLGSKSRLIVEPEFARVLIVANREGSTLSAVLRELWDSGSASVLTRKEPLRATGTHVAVIGHVTTEELLRRLTTTEVANGFANRFLLVLVRRSKLLPHGARVDQKELATLATEVRARLATARTAGLLRRTDDANAVWEVAYRRWAEQAAAGLVGALTARPEAQALRLSLVYALLDGASAIGPEHVRAAVACVDYAEASARYVFGESLGDETADRLLAAIRDAGKEGLDGEGQRAVFSRHVSAIQLTNARALLERQGLITTETEQTGGRPRLVSRAVGL